MALKHIIAHTETEIVFKCYVIDPNGGTVDLSLENDMTKSTQQYVVPTSIPNDTGNGGVGPFNTYNGSAVYISEMYWGMKHNKFLDISRIIDPAVPTLHNHYYLVNAGFYNFKGFTDRVYANKDLRLTFDGPGHCILKLRKDGWASKIETAQFSIYDNPNAVGS